MFKSHQAKKNKIYCVLEVNNKNTSMIQMCFWCNTNFINKTMVALILIFEQTLIATLNKYLLVEQNNSIAYPRHAMCLGHVFLLVFECVLAFNIMSYKINTTYDLRIIYSNTNSAQIQCNLNKLYGTR